MDVRLKSNIGGKELEKQADSTIHKDGQDSDVTSVMEEEQTIREKLLEAEKRLGDFLDRVKDLRKQEMGHGG